MEDEDNTKWLKELEKISKRVEKMPQWKKEGWAILDKRTKYYCATIDLNNEEDEIV